MEDLDKVAHRRNEEWERLEKTIVALVKEHYRLLGKPYYEHTTPELETAIKGEG